MQQRTETEPGRGLHLLEIGALNRLKFPILQHNYLPKAGLGVAYLDLLKVRILYHTDFI